MHAGANSNDYENLGVSLKSHKMEGKVRKAQKELMTKLSEDTPNMLMNFKNKHSYLKVNDSYFICSC